MPINVKVLIAVAVLAPTAMLLSGSVILFCRLKSVWSSFQVLGAASLVVAVLTHVFEALHVFPGMQWGQGDSIGHYVDLSSVVLGCILFPVGYLVCALRARPICRPTGTTELQ
jgi:hypothetical protein